MGKAPARSTALQFSIKRERARALRVTLGEMLADAENLAAGKKKDSAPGEVIFHGRKADR